MNRINIYSSDHVKSSLFETEAQTSNPSKEINPYRSCHLNPNQVLVRSDPT